jgi:hypothetical protein
MHSMVVIVAILILGLIVFEAKVKLSFVTEIFAPSFAQFLVLPVDLSFILVL